MAGQNNRTQTQPNMDQFEVFFKRADLDQDGRISGKEAVNFFQGANLPRQVLAQIWTIADQNRTGFLGRQEFNNALKLVTVAQSKRELTPDIVKAALYSPASAKIPPPQINITPPSSHQSNVAVGSSVPPPSASTLMAPQTVDMRGPQGFASQQSQVTRPPRPPTPSTSFQPPQVLAAPAVPSHGGNMGVSHPPSSSAWAGSQVGVPSQANRSIRPLVQDGITLAASGSPLSAQPGAQRASLLTQPASLKPSNISVGGQVEVKESKSLAVAGNGHAPDSLFGDAFSVSSIQPKQDHAKVTPPVSTSPVSSATTPGSSGAQSTVKTNPLDSFQMTPGRPPTGIQHQQGNFPAQSNQQIPVQASTATPPSITNSAAGQSQHPWPRMTPSDIQKYSKVFMQVDTDRDGKITGEQARNLFLSWRLPREILKQVWDLSDQDNDSMLSLREFCIALFLMERFREGRPPPSALPNSIVSDEALLSVSNQPVVAPANTAWRATPAFQPQVMKGTRSVASRPPRPVPGPLPGDAMPPSRQKPKVPELEKDLLDQLSTEEQNLLNSKFQEAKDAENKVAELEKEITEAKEKIQFYHSKMQELILYKSRCDNRLNEITARVSADRQEVDSMAKKYEEKYRQAGDVASKLTLEEATFRDIQEKKMELYRAIVKLEQGGDGVQESANRTQLDLEELVKSLNERCKTYGLRAKPISLVELPFGWQPGIQEGAADWDENWDKFEDEGYTFVKELTLDVENVVAPPKYKSSLVREKESSRDENGVVKSSSGGDVKAEKVNSTGQNISEDEGANTHTDMQSANSPPESPARSNALESESKGFEDSHFKKDVSFDGSPHATSKEDIGFDGSPNAKQSGHWNSDSMFSGDKGFDEPSWGTFDTQYDADSAWDLNHAKDSVPERQNDDSLFGSDNWGLNPIKTGSRNTDNTTYSKQGAFFDSVPSTPMTQGAFFDSVPSTPMKPGAFFDSVPSTPMKPGAFFDSVPSTPMKQGSFFDSVPSTPMYNTGNSPDADSMFQRKSPFAFADSVPSTPMYNSSNSPRRYNEASEDRSFDSFSRFNSFNMHDGGLFAPSEPSLSRFDSITKDSEYDRGLFASRDLARFDSFRSTADSDYNFGALPPRETFSRFDSIRSTGDSDFGHGFSSFDDTDTFGSSDTFKASVETQTPRRDSNSWKAF